jgi:hypothetical protein
MDVYSHLIDEGLGETPFAPMLSAGGTLRAASTGLSAMSPADRRDWLGTMCASGS